MTPFRATTGVVDRLQGLPLPHRIKLFAIAVSKRPNLDGTSPNPSDIVSDCPVEVEFESDRHQLRNRSRVRIPLIRGSWRELYIQLRDQDGEPFARGAAAMCGSACDWLEAAPDMITVASRA